MNKVIEALTMGAQFGAFVGGAAAVGTLLMGSVLCLGAWVSGKIK